MGNRLLNHIVDNDADREVCIRGNSEYKNNVICPDLSIVKYH